MSHLLISAAHKSSGKTTIGIGLCAALSKLGKVISPFKKGPDYIDPMWLTRASGSPCYNLDFNTMGHEEILATFSHYSKDSDISIIEGNKGLYDGLDLHGSNSNAALATLLGAPVILVVDAQGMTRGIAPLILGYQAFEPELNIAGIILNKLGGSRHEAKLRAVIEHYTEVPVLGAVHRDKKLQIVERHLGLTPSNETSSANKHIDNIAELIEQQVDLEGIATIAQSARLPQTSYSLAVATNSIAINPDIKIGIAKDTAFGFYYPDDLQAFEQAGAELIPINTLEDQQLPDIDGLFIGGGFPETQMAALQANSNLRTQIKHRIEQGLPVYAECGGLMYLTRSLTWRGKCFDMVGAIPADTLMHDKPQGRGYVRLRQTEMHPWLSGANETGPREIAAHEFHYSSLENCDKDLEYAYDVIRGNGIDGNHDGIIFRNVLGSYTHMRQTQNNPWVNHFVDYVRRLT